MNDLDGLIIFLAKAAIVIVLLLILYSIAMAVV